MGRFSTAQRKYHVPSFVRKFNVGSASTMFVILMLFGNFFSPAGVAPTGAFKSEQSASAISAGTNGFCDQAQAGTPWLQICFTKPPEKKDEGIDKYIVEAIKNANKTIDVTSFDLNLPSVVDALIDAANKRDIKVRVVYDGQKGNQTITIKNKVFFDAISEMKKGKKIQLKDGGHYSKNDRSLMHDKIIIIDGKVLFMGSWNISYNDTYLNNNNLLRVTDPTLIANYQAVFNEIFQDTDSTHTVGAKKQEFTIGTIKVNNYFSPTDHVMNKVVTLVNGAQKSIRFLAFTYTDSGLSGAMLARAKAKAGVTVEGVFEEFQTHIQSDGDPSESEFLTLACAKLKNKDLNINVKLDGWYNKHTMHDKVIIIDDNIVITGSFNFTTTADSANDENVLVIYDAKVAEQYIDEFHRIFDNSNSKTLNDLRATTFRARLQPGDYTCPKS